ncbi:MAG: DUF5706 domain-containing protein [Vicingaceae bacterium]
MDLIQSVKEHVKSRFESSTAGQLPYHNWKHTENVFNAAELIASNSSISFTDQQLINLKIAALFHDIGYLDSPKNHEEKSADIAEDYLKTKGFNASDIEEVKRLIKATKLNHTAKDDLERVIMDADLSHLGKDNYLKTTYKYLKEEISDTQKEQLTDKDWAESCFSFLKAHQYLTDFAKKHFGSVKDKNMEEVKTLLQKETKNDSSVSSSTTKKKKSKKPVSPLKGVETMYKTALRNHMDLSAIADRKANTLISVNAIIISIVLSALFPKLDSNPYLFLPGVTILLSCIVTVILSILSTIPNVTRGLVTEAEVKNKEGNLIFFGNFHKMSLANYERSMNILMNDKDYLYNTLSRDLFFLGKVLNKKYRILRFSYIIFVIGLLASIAVFIINAMPFLGTNI